MELRDTEDRFMVARGRGGEGGEMGGGGRKAQTSSYKIKKSWGWNVCHGDYS